MSPKRLPNKETAPASPAVRQSEATDEELTAANGVPQIIGESAELADGQDESTRAESTTGTASSDDADSAESTVEIAKPAPTRSTPAAQAANRARRIGGSAVRSAVDAASNVNAKDSEVAEPLPAATDPKKPDLTKPGVNTSAQSEGDPTVSGLTEPRRPRGMTGRPGAKSRVEKIAAPVAETTTKSRGRLGVEAVIAAVLAVVAVALAVVNVLVWHPWQHTDKTAQLRSQILASVNQATALVLSYDYRRWDASAAAAEVYLTGQFKTDYSKAMTGTLKGTGISTQTVVVGKVDNSGLVSINSRGTQATVAVYAERSKTNTSNTEPTVDLLALQITANKVNGKWLIGQFGYIDG